jgi:hypothetical protein
VHCRPPGPEKPTEGARGAPVFARRLCYNEDMENGDDPPFTPSSLRRRIFCLLGSLYLSVYGVFLALRLGDYGRDALRHFAFLRRWLGLAE